MKHLYYILNLQITNSDKYFTYRDHVERKEPKNR